MKATKIGLVFASLGLLIAVSVTPSSAQQGEGGVSGNTLWSQLTMGRGGKGTNKQSVTNYTFDIIEGGCLFPPGNIFPDLEAGPNTPNLIIDNETGGLAVAACVGPGTPLPPTSAQVMERAEIPEPSINRLPGSIGLTGLPTKLWADPTGSSVSVPTIEIDGYTVRTTANLIGYYWRLGDGAEAITYNPGSASNPAVEHTYESKGTYTLELEVAWHAYYSFEGYGISGGPFDLGPVIMGTSETFPVQEVRSVLTG